MGVSPILVSFHLGWFSTQPWSWEEGSFFLGGSFLVVPTLDAKAAQDTSMVGTDVSNSVLAFARQARLGEHRVMENIPWWKIAGRYKESIDLENIWKRFLNFRIVGFQWIPFFLEDSCIVYDAKRQDGKHGAMFRIGRIKLLDLHGRKIIDLGIVSVYAMSGHMQVALVINCLCSI